MIRTADHAGILLKGTPLIDVRAPVEFIEGSLPGSFNLPLMNTQERHQVGLKYKTDGQQAAIELGHKLVSGSVKQERISAWISFIKQHPDAVLYCFRGGLRSRISQEWLKDAGFEIPVIEGGYKAVRRFLLDTLSTELPKLNFQIIGGPTGSGKTQFIKEKEYYIDLEKIANHRGSAFGGFTDSPQPSQIDFENKLILEILRLKDVRDKIYLESESRMIGRCALPPVFHEKMLLSPREEIERPLSIRVQNIYKEYILESPLGRKKDESHFVFLQKSLDGIAKKLGGLRYQEITRDLEHCKAVFRSTGNLEANKVWIEKLLQWYYDPVYAFGRNKKKEPASKNKI